MKDALSSLKKVYDEDRKLKEPDIQNINFRQNYCKKSQLKLL